MKFYLTSLGCDKNLVDSEVMLGLLVEAGHVYEDDPSTSDVIIINTCCFIQDAMQESINTIIELSQLKKDGCVKGIVVTGCLSQRYKDEFLSALPEVDAIIGTAGYDDIVYAVEYAISKSGYRNFCSIGTSISDEIAKKRIVTMPAYSASLKIAEGCDKHCTYCIIPKIRGKYRSRSIQSLISEAEYLARCGVRELIVVAQDTSVYGFDIYGEYKLPKLLEQLCTVSGIEWIRLMYCYPENVSDELIYTIVSNDKICNYIDIPVQHINDNILKKMGRRTNSNEIRNVIRKLKDNNICIRTSLITGFPGETDAEFSELLDFVRKIEFDNLGIFTYSREEGTKAFDLVNQIEEKVKILRKNKILRVQQKIVSSKNNRAVGRIFDVLIEGKDKTQDFYCGRSFMNAPEIDGLVFVKSDISLMSGDIVPVRICNYRDYDLIGGVDYESSKQNNYF